MRPTSRLTSVSLINGLIQQDETTWRRFVQLYGPLVHDWLLRFQIRQGSIEDLHQEILVAVSQNIAKYQHDGERSGSLRRWMWGITRNKIHAFHRSEACRVVGVGGSVAARRLVELPEIPPEDSDPDEGASVKKMLVHRALQIIRSDFEDKTFEAFQQTVMHQQTTQEVAERLNMSTQAVRQARFRVLRRLREELGDDLPY